LLAVDGAAPALRPSWRATSLLVVLGQKCASVTCWQASVHHLRQELRALLVGEVPRCRCGCAASPRTDRGRSARGPGSWFHLQNQGRVPGLGGAAGEPSAGGAAQSSPPELLWPNRRRTTKATGSPGRRARPRRASTVSSPTRTGTALRRERFEALRRALSRRPAEGPRAWRGRGRPACAREHSGAGRSGRRARG